MARFLLTSAAVLLASAGCASDAKQASPSPPTPETAAAPPTSRATKPAETVGELPGRIDAEAVSEVMYMKTVFAAPLLQAIASRDYATIERNAEELRALSTQAAFIVNDTVAYRAMCETFRDDVTRLAAHAREGNQAAVEDDYHRMTATCFNCHAHVREERAKGSLPGRVTMR